MNANIILEFGKAISLSSSFLSLKTRYACQLRDTIEEVFKGNEYKTLCAAYEDGEECNVYRGEDCGYPITKVSKFYTEDEDGEVTTRICVELSNNDVVPTFMLPIEDLEQVARFIAISLNRTQEGKQVLPEDTWEI